MPKVIKQKEIPIIGKISPNVIINGDCIAVMEQMEPGSIDMVIADLPYG